MTSPIKEALDKTELATLEFVLYALDNIPIDSAITVIRQRKVELEIEALMVEEPPF